MFSEKVNALFEEAQSDPIKAQILARAIERTRGIYSVDDVFQLAPEYTGRQFTREEAQEIGMYIGFVEYDVFHKQRYRGGRDMDLVERYEFSPRARTDPRVIKGCLKMLKS